MTVPIYFTLSTLVTSVSITSVVRGDNQQVPGGITLPIACTAGTPFGSPVQYPWTASFTTTDPTAPAFYFANGLINGFEPFNGLTIFSAGAPAGMWGTFAQACGIYSGDNINLWSTSRGASAPDPTMQQAAFNQADADIMAKFSEYYCQIPGPLANYAIGTPIYSSVNQLSWVEARLMGANLYLANGLQDSVKGMDGKIQAHVDKAMGDLKEMLFLNRGGFVRATGYQDAPVSRPATVDPSGNWVDPYPPYPVPRWTGYRYLWQSGPGGWSAVPFGQVSCG